MIALRVQDPTARHEEASNDNTVLRLSGRRVRTDFHPSPLRWLPDARTKDSIIARLTM